MKTVALTGATGFVGSRVLARLLVNGFSVRALTRQSPTFENQSLRWVEGSLSNSESLAELCKGADTVIHIAGVIKAQNEADFIAGNITGTETIIAAAKQADIKRIVYVSSITAREALLSHYAQTKAGAERCVENNGLNWTIIRLSAVYGPGDKETLAFFKAAKSIVLPISNPQAKLSLIHIDDAASAIVAACGDPMIGQKIELSDGLVLTQAALAKAIAKATGGRPLIIPLPRFLAWCAGGISELAAKAMRKAPMLTRKKVAELYHGDWSTTDTRLTTQTGWYPGIDLESGLKQTVAWYKGRGWL